MGHQANALPSDAMPHGLDGFDFSIPTVVRESAGPGWRHQQRLQVQHLAPIYPLQPTMHEATPAVAPMWGVHIQPPLFLTPGENTGPGPNAIQPGEGAGGQSRLRQDWDHHQEALRTSIDNIRNGFLEAGSQSLLSTTTWLVNRVPDLGLDDDPRDPNTAEEVFNARLGVWRAMNFAWLALCSKQLEVMQLQPQARGAIMCRATIAHMGNELLRLCDVIQKDGLVDYEYGVWEETIVGQLILCLDQYDYPPPQAQT
ncbi:hypothetical protein B0J13DRAFT_185041 [Dactylonectria estremocensis]|uniref:Uncharacterized protein n=1 Tax=Dactylonectria estremocensis TaxID=1079267 RepID=A0A9P9JEW8_9HYPO|nr:hypothetical protein B0J13DRAFT_185041 [Dactylonectria estremocensis]